MSAVCRSVTGYPYHFMHGFDDVYQRLAKSPELKSVPVGILRAAYEAGKAHAALGIGPISKEEAVNFFQKLEPSKRRSSSYARFTHNFPD